MTIGVAPDCLTCAFYWSEYSEGMCCSAYPYGIPESIILGSPHMEVFNDQEGHFVYTKNVSGIIDCLKCIYHWEDEGRFCEAYPNGIPADIQLGIKHVSVRKDQEGNFIFEEKENG
jgi:hypothetical protein